MKIQLTNENASKYALLLILGTFIIRILLASFTGLGIGEAYYVRGSIYPDWSYFDQPPLFLWLSAGTIRLFGLTNFALRLPAVLFFAGTSWFLFLCTKKMFSARAGFYAVLMLNLSIVFTVSIALWFQPDAPLMFFWMACLWCILNILFPTVETSPHHPRVYLLWVIVGILLGLTTLSKYHALLLLAGVFLFLLFSKSQRHWIGHPGPYIAVILAVVIAFPIFYWNAQHDWISFVFQGQRAGGGESFSLHPEWFLRSVLGQAAWLYPWIWVPLVGQFFRSYREGKTNLSHRLFFLIGILPVAFFTLVTLWSNTQYHFHWQAPGYLVMFIPFGGWIESRLRPGDKKSRSTRRWIRFSVIFTCFMTIIIGLHTTTGFWQKDGPRSIVQHFGGSEDPTIWGVDFDDIHRRFEKEGWLKKDSLFVGTYKWWQAGKIDVAVGEKKEMLVFSSDARNYAFLTHPSKLLGYDAIIVDNGDEDDVRNHIASYFKSIKKLKPIPIIRGGVTEMSFDVYYCKGFHVPDSVTEPTAPVFRQLHGLSPY